MMAKAMRLCQGPDCKSLRSHLSDLLDGALTSAQKAQARAHMKGCPACDREYREFAAMVKACRSLPEPKQPDACCQKLREAYQRWALALKPAKALAKRKKAVKEK